MKKLLALLLVAVMCLPLVACGADQSNNSAQAKEFLGKWVLFGQDGYMIEILENGVAKTHSPDEVKNLNWYYNSQMKGIFLAENGENPYFMQISEELDCRYLLMDGNALYHEEDLKFAENAEIKRKEKLIDARFAQFESLKLGESYTLIDGVTIQVHEFIREGDKLNIRVSVTNTTQSVMALASIGFYSGFVYNRTSHATRHAALSMQNTALTGGQTQELTLSTDYATKETKIDYALFGLTFNEVTYYLNITEYVK